VHRVGKKRIVGPVRTFFGMPFAWLRMWKASAGVEADAVHAHDLDALLPGVLAAWSKGVPLVYDAHEWYSKMVARDLPLSRLWIDRAENLLLRRVDKVVTVNSALQGRFRDAGCEVTVVMNTPPLGKAGKNEAAKEIRLFYGGTLEPGRYVLEMLDALKDVPDWTMTLAGYGRYEDEVKRRAAEDRRIRFLGWIDRERVMAEMAAADVILCPLDAANENYRIATPNRLLEAMSAARPVIATKGTLGGEMAEQIGCGLSIVWSAEAFRGSVEKLRDPRIREMMGGNGRSAAEKEYNWDVMRRRLLAIYDSLQVGEERSLNIR
jgi:glycosyltransferase involved in cell wall biosynthesis